MAGDASSMGSVGTEFNYELLWDLFFEKTIPVRAFRSSATGVTIVIANVPGPMVNGYFQLSTEAHDDDGLPHTLEHLVFMGSEDYPFKGVLDLLANRCFAQGTNAWTDTDYTTYTVETAGAEGFLNFMPVSFYFEYLLQIYVEHILYPTLTDSAYMTEVYHVTGEGEDAGVVYCEMQGRENTGESRTHLELLRETYPGHCGFKSETGGIMWNLRESTSNEKVRQYHADFYRPDNLTLIITGQVDPRDVFVAMKKMDEKIALKLRESPLKPMKKPWTSEVPDFTTSVKRKVLYGNDTEDKGMVILGYRGPKATEVYKSVAMQIILDYFVDTSVAPLRQAFVEAHEPLCSNVKWSGIEATVGLTYFRFINVKFDSLDDVKPKFDEVVETELRKGLDMNRIASIIEKKRLETLDALEDAPHEAVMGEISGFILHGREQAELEERFNSVQALAKMAGEPASYWVELMREFTSQPYAEIIGVPSKVEKERLAKEVEDRVAERKEKLGEEGLAKLGEDLENAAEENETEPPDELLSLLPVPDPGKISFHNVAASSNYSRPFPQHPSPVPLQSVPFTLQLDDIWETQFIAWVIMMDCKNLPEKLSPYLMLWTELVGETAVKGPNGEIIPYETVVAGLERDLLFHSCAVGIEGGRFNCGAFPGMLTLSMKVDQKMDKYRAGVDWAHKLIYRPSFEPERVKSIVNKLLNTVDSYKRNGRSVTGACYTKLMMAPKSNPANCMVLEQERILQNALHLLDSEPDTLIEKLYRIGEHLGKCENLRVHLTTSVKKFSSPSDVVDLWKLSFLPEENTPANVEPPSSPFETVMNCQLKRPLEEVNTRGVVVGVGAVESSFMVQSAHVDITTYDHPDIPALMVLIEYLVTLEGPMWRLIRGLGYSYGYSINLSIETGLLSFRLFKATNPVKAYEKAVEIANGFVDKSEEFDDTTLEAVRSSVIYEVIEREKTIGEATVESLFNHLRKMPSNYNKDLLEKVSKIELEDVERVCQKYLPKLFDGKDTVCAICCHPNKVDEIQRAFQAFPEKNRRDLAKFSSFEEFFSAEL